MTREKEPSQEGEELKKPETPMPVPEKGEARIDTEYSNSISRYFNGIKNKMAEVRTTEASDEDLMYEQFLTEQQNTLSKLASPKKLEKMQPTDVSFALAELSGTMAATNPESPWVNRDDENLIKEVIQEREDLYLDTKKLYMESCKKMFPDTEISLSPSQLHLELRKIKKVDLFKLEGSTENPHIEVIPVSEIQRLLKENPKELLKKIDEVLRWVGDQMKRRAYGRFELFQEDEKGGDMESVAKEEKRLGTLAEPLYKLQLIKDELIKQVYGNSDMKPSERMEVDKLKNKV